VRKQLLGSSSLRTFTDTATPTTTGQPTTPEQVHLAIGHHPSEMTVQWAMQASPPPPSSSSAEAIKVEYWREMETMPTAVVSSVPAIVEPFPVPVSWEVTGTEPFLYLWCFRNKETPRHRGMNIGNCRCLFWFAQCTNATRPHNGINIEMQTICLLFREHQGVAHVGVMARKPSHDCYFLFALF
jgi:hypothetical protein